MTWLRRNLEFWTDTDFCGWSISSHSIWKVMPSRHLTGYNILRDTVVHTHTQHWSIDWNRGTTQGCQIYFFKKGQTFSKKGQKRPKKLLKKAEPSIKKGQKEPNPSLDKAKFVKICLLTTQLHIKIHLACSQRLHKSITSKLFLEFVIYDRKMPEDFFFLKKTSK